MKRFYLKDKAKTGGFCTIEGSEARHMAKVLRLKPGDPIVVFDGVGFDYDAEIVEIGPQQVSIAIVRKYPSKPESQARITVAQALLKGKKMDVLLRQMTEIGVAQWVPFMAERSIPNPDSRRRDDRVERWQSIVREALKQSRRGEFTQVQPIVPFEDMLAMGQDHQAKIIFWEDAVDPLEQVVRSFPSDTRSIWVILGPEGGFAEWEVEAAQKTGFHSVSLGSRILRAETAALSVCVLMQYLFGDLGRV